MKRIEKIAATEISSFPPRSVMLAQELESQREQMNNQMQQSQIQQNQMSEQQTTPGGQQTPQAQSGSQASRGQGQGAGTNKAQIELIVRQPGGVQRGK